MIPAELQAHKGWLLWRLEPQETPGKPPRKVPYYANGEKRWGEQGSGADRARLTTYGMAKRILDDDLAGTWAGLGLAMLPEWGLVGLDFDNCVADGVVDPAVLDVVGSTYSEFSPSGTGIHAFLEGSLPDRKYKGEPWGFETFCAKGFLTMTGRETEVSELCFSGTLGHVNGAVSDLFTARFGSVESGIVVATAPRGLTMVDVAALLLRVTPDGSYHDWIRRGMAIHHESSGADWGLEIWDVHSKRGVDYAGRREIEAKWRSFGRREVGVTEVTLATLEAMAAPEDVFSVVVEDDPVSGANEPHALERSGPRTPANSPATAINGSPPTPSSKRRGIPEARHLTTDLANANRLVRSFGKRVLVSAGRWHAWDGARWVEDESDVYRYTSKLSLLIHEEAKATRARAADGDDEAKKKAAAIAGALEKWAVKSEMKGAIEAAIGLAKKMLAVDPGMLNRDPMLLNVANGTVDLRTGVIKAHDPDDYITRISPVAYRPEAACALWESVVLQIMGGDSELVGFLRRWVGYCLTASVIEQVFVVHWGGGSNGKSTVLGVMDALAGDYAATAAPGLLQDTKGSGDRHPTEIAALFGKRMVTAHETSENVVLREAFVKQATGGDKLTARYMHQDFFSWTSTHKLQLLTNHKPQIKGTDPGIWRRVLLLPYGASWGTADEVRVGERMYVEDKHLAERLAAEMEGVLAWAVRGALEWYQAGLRPPPRVREASALYRSQQDRIGKFVSECCELGPESTHFEPLTDGQASGLYPAFVQWCREGNVFPMSKERFQDDVLRVIPGGRMVLDRSRVEGRQRSKRLVMGIRLLPE